MTCADIGKEPDRPRQDRIEEDAGQSKYHHPSRLDQASDLGSLGRALGQRAATAAAYVPLSFTPAGSLPVRLEPRGRPAEWRDSAREGRPCPALPQPHAVRPSLPARAAGDGVRRSRPGVRSVQGQLRTPHL